MRVVVELNHLVEIPEGWDIVLFKSWVVAVHPDHTPRMIQLTDPLLPYFNRWPRLSL